MAIGSNAKANLGSTKMKGSELKGAAVNLPVGQVVTNMSIGKDTEANLGSTNLENSKIKGAAINTPGGTSRSTSHSTGFSW